MDVRLLWVSKLRKLWLSKDIESISSLFSSDVTYYETPFKRVNNIKGEWLEIKNQKIMSLDYKILSYKDKGLIVNFILVLPTSIIDMVYDVEFNEEGKCSYFKQWFMEE